MKILKSQLKRIIKEEYNRMISEADGEITAASIKQRAIDNLNNSIAHLKKVGASGKPHSEMYAQFADALEKGEIKYYASGISSRGKFGIQPYVQLPSGELFSIAPGHPLHPDANRFRKNPPAPELEYTPEEAEAALESDAANARAIQADQQRYYARNPRGNWSGD